ncbi:MAG: hypothetical protein IKN15_00780 [Bacteroidaceae bacterium]|nr:hypothetical protein [Bacteroidaceae bacterium]
MKNLFYLNSCWLVSLTNADHDNTTQMIDNCVRVFTTDNARFLLKAEQLHQCRQYEDELWLKSQRDPAVNLLTDSYERMCNYMTTSRMTIDAYTNLPAGEAKKAEAEVCKQVFKDYKFSASNSKGAKADKVIQMQQNFQPHQEFLTEIGVWTYFMLAVEQAQLVRHYLLERARTKGDFVKGEMQTARKATDDAVANLYQTIYAMMDLVPSAELTALYNQLHGIELYAKQYYIPGANGSSSSGQGTTSPDPSQGGENGDGDNEGSLTPNENQNQNENGGGENQGSENGGGETPPAPTVMTLTITKQGTGSSTVTIAGNAVNSGSQIGAGTQVDIAVTPAYGQTPTATLNGQEVELTQNASVYEGSFQMPQTDATLVINSGSTGGGGVDQN